jgi:hypothetical protein
MKMKHIAGAVALALLGGNAFAAISENANGFPIFSTASGGDTVEVRLSGASAPRGVVETLVTRTEELCAPGAVIYKFQDSINNREQEAFLCEANRAAGKPLAGLTKPNILFRKRSEGGSAQGVQPIIGDASNLQGIPLSYMKVQDSTCDSPTSSSLTSLSGGPNRTRKTATCTYTADSTQGVLEDANTQEDLISHFGVSDADPGVFKGVNTPSGFTDVTDTSNITIKPAFLIAFGIPATTGLRNALQEAQIATGELPSTCTVGDDSEACMPSLSDALVTSIATGMLNYWADVKVKHPTLGLVSLPDLASDKPGDYPDGQVHWCRRVNGSGTQATFNVKYLRNPCVDGALAPLGPNAGSGSYSTYTPVDTGTWVFANSSSGGVDNCLNGLGDPALDRWAIGVQSTENNALTETRNYRFVKTNGYAPTIKNTALGKNLYTGELTYQYNNTRYTGMNGDEKKVVDGVIARTGVPAVVEDINKAFAHNTDVAGKEWQGGILASSAFNNPLDPTNNDAAFEKEWPVSQFTTAPAGFQVNNCRPMVLNGPTYPTTGGFPENEL